LRQANVFWLEWGQVDRARKKAWIHPDEAKGRDAIGVPLSAAALAVLEQQRGKSDVWVFPDGGREPPAEAQDAGLEGRCEGADIAYCTWHDLRHTWATWHLMNGTPLEVLQRLGGWKDLTDGPAVRAHGRELRGPLRGEREALQTQFRHNGGVSA
jgi:integrase